MKRLFVVLTFLLPLVPNAPGEIIYQESFESGPVTGSTYEARGAHDDGTSDYFVRQDKNGTLRSQYLNHPTGSSVDGSWYWIGEDIDNPDTPTTAKNIQILLESVTVTGYSNLTQTIAIAHSNSTKEPGDGVEIYLSTNGAASNLVASVMGWPDDSNTSFFALDVGLDGTGDGGTQKTTTDLTDFSWAIADNHTAPITSLKATVIVYTDFGSEEIAVDNYRITGDAPPPIPPTIKTFETQFDFAPGGVMRFGRLQKRRHP